MLEESVRWAYAGANAGSGIDGGLPETELLGYEYGIEVL